MQTAQLERRRFKLRKLTIWKKPSQAVWAMIRGTELYIDGGYTNVQLDAGSYGHWNGKVCYGCFAMLAIFDTDNMVVADPAAPDYDGGGSGDRNVLRHLENPKFRASRYCSSEVAVDMLRSGELQAFLAYWMDPTTATIYKNRFCSYRGSPASYSSPLPYLEYCPTTEQLDEYRKFAEWLEERDL